MLHGSPSRSAHRAAPEAPLTLLVRQRPYARQRPHGQKRAPVRQRPLPIGSAAGPDCTPNGQHRQPSRRRAPSEPQRATQLMMSGLAALIVFGICGLIGFVIVSDARRHTAKSAGQAAAPVPLTFATRRIDPIPLRLEEVFPATEIRLVPGAAPYLVGMTHIDTDCDIAATGRLGQALRDRACSQVVRASLTAPYGGYQVTAGIFNLADQAGAKLIGDRARDLIETGDGTFAVMSAGGPGTDPLRQPLAQVGWHERGHYLVYCVIVRPDGQVVRDDDPYAKRITDDLVEAYLGDQILGQHSPRP